MYLETVVGGQLSVVRKRQNPKAASHRPPAVCGCKPSHSCEGKGWLVMTRASAPGLKPLITAGDSSPRMNPRASTRNSQEPRAAASSQKPRARAKNQEPRAKSARKCRLSKTLPANPTGSRLYGPTFSPAQWNQDFTGYPPGEGARGLRPQKLSVVSCRLSEKTKAGSPEDGILY